MPQPYPALPSTFTSKKSRILADLAIPDANYHDKSPKGSVDVGIRGLIDEINAYEGFVTTSSCAGRISVFVEGVRDVSRGSEGDVGPGGGGGGKGGGRWLFVSHEPVGYSIEMGLSNTEKVGEKKSLIEAFGLMSPPTLASTSTVLENHSSPTSMAHTKSPRLIRLSFEPLILHILCASLSHARPLLAAAISAGFRESGVQSLKNLADTDVCPVVAVRSAGLGLETVIGLVKEIRETDGVEGLKGECGEVYEAAVSEEYLEMMVRVANGRFVENESRRERFREELKRAMARELATVNENGHDEDNGWEDTSARRARKREEGLRRQEQKRRRQENQTNGEDVGVSENLDDLLLG